MPRGWWAGLAGPFATREEAARFAVLAGGWWDDVTYVGPDAQFV